MKTLRYLSWTALLLFPLHLVRAAAKADTAAPEVVAKLLQCIRQVPLWRSDRLWTLEEWRACGACAREFQAASVPARTEAVQAYQNWLREKRTSFTADGTGTYPSQIYLLLRVCYQVEKHSRQINALDAKSPNGMYPLACKDDTLEMIGLPDWSSGLYLPAVDLKRIHSLCPLRDLTRAKVKLPDGTVVPLLR